MKQYPKHMKMSELSARAKIPAATIHNYARQRLLPEPIRTGKTMALKIYERRITDLEASAGKTGQPPGLTFARAVAMPAK